MNELITKNLPEGRRLCELHRVERLDVFGSVTGDHFSEGSDIDFLVRFSRDRKPDAFRQYFQFKESLEALLGREVDVICEAAIRNGFFKREIADTRQELYAA